MTYSNAVIKNKSLLSEPMRSPSLPMKY